MPPKNSNRKKATGKKSPKKNTRASRSAAAVKRRNSASDADVPANNRASKKMKPTVPEIDVSVTQQPAESEEPSQNSTVYAPMNEVPGSLKSSQNMEMPVPGQANKRTDTVGESSIDQGRVSTVGLHVDHDDVQKTADQPSPSKPGTREPENSQDMSDDLPFDVAEVSMVAHTSKLKVSGKGITRPGENSDVSVRMENKPVANVGRKRTVAGPSSPGTTETTDRGNSVKEKPGPLQQSRVDTPDSERAERVEGPVTMSQPSVGSEKHCPNDSETSAMSKGDEPGREKGKWGKNSVEAKYKAIMDKECPRMQHIFHRRSVATAIASAMTDVMYTEISSKECITSADLVMMMNLLMFGKQKKSKKSECFSSPVGLLASAFRKKCIKNCVLHITRGLVPESNMKISKDDLKTRPEFAWLRKVIPSSTMCDTVSEMKEKKGCGASSKQSHSYIGQGIRQPGMTDITEFALSNAYTAIVTALHANRKAAKKMFFSRLGYLMTDWETVRFRDVEQDGAAMWVKPMNKTDYLRPSEVPQTTVALSAARAKEADVENLKLYNDFLKERQELVVVVQHSVKVKTLKKDPSALNTAYLGNVSVELQTRPFRRSFSLAGIALSVFSEICAVTPNDTDRTQVLKFHRRSLAVCYVMAIAFKEMIRSCEDVITFGFSVDENGKMDSGLGAQEEVAGQRNNTGYTLEPNCAAVIRDMMAIGETESRHELERTVGNVKEKFWKENHIVNNDGIVPAGIDEQNNPSAPEVDELEGLDPESIELDM